MNETIFFSGSGARIASHLGAAQALSDMGIVGDSYGGISGGAIVATFAAMGMLDEVRAEILNSTPGKVFFPHIFDRTGDIRPLQGFLGWCLYGPNAFASLTPLRERLRKIEIGNRWAYKMPLYTYLYERGKGVVRKNSSMYSWYEWVDILIAGASIPGLIDSGDYSDAGIVRQLPLEEEFSDDAICLVTAQEEPSPYLVDDILRRVAIDNVKDEEQFLRQRFRKLNILHLPSCNRVTEYEPELLRKSHRKAYEMVKGANLWT